MGKLSKIKIIHMPTGMRRGSARARFSCADFPLNAGYVKSYLRSKKINSVEILFNSKFAAAPDSFYINYAANKKTRILIAFIYPWNQERSLFVINNAKRKLPGLKTIVLGSQICFPNYELMKKNKIDFAVTGSGEEAVYKIVKSILDGEGNFKNARGIIYKENGKIKLTRSAPCAISVSKIPSPYLNGSLSSLREHPLILYETQRGCSFNCGYCYFGSVKIKKSILPLSRVYKEMLWAKKNGVKNILFLDPVFNRPAGRAAKICESLTRINSDNGIEFEAFIHAQILNKETAKLLKEAGFINLEIPLITVHSKIARKTGFKNNIKKWLAGISFLREAGINFTIDIILGLPGDSLKGFKKTVDFLTEKGLNGHSECFILSLHPSTKLARGAEKLKIKYQKEPPHHILSSPGFPPADIKKALRYAEDRGVRSCNKPRQKLGSGTCKIRRGLASQKLQSNFCVCLTPRIVGFCKPDPGGAYCKT